DPAMVWGTSYIGFNAVRIPNTPSSKNWFIASDGANNGAAAIYSNVGGDLYFATIPRDADNNAAQLDKSLTDIQFLDTRKVVISSKGNVGIGEMNPHNKLEIKGVADTGLRLPTGKGAGKILTSDVDGNAVWRPATDVTANLWRTLANPNNIRNGNIGNVGIGTDTPDAKLDVCGAYGDVNGQGVLKLIGDQEDAGASLRFGLKNGIDAHAWIQSYGNVPLKINPHTAGSVTTINETGGNVGIGVKLPTEKLEVNGSLQLEGNLYGRNAGGEFLIHAVKDARGGAYMHLRSSDYAGANGNQGGISFVARKGTANPKQNGFVFQQHNPLESPEWPRCLTIDGNRNSYYHNNKIYLRNIDDQNHGLAYYGSDNGNFKSVDVNGPVLFGYNGGALGGMQGTSSTIALRWTYDHKVGIGVPNPQYLLHVGSKLENYAEHYRWWKKDGDKDGFYVDGPQVNIPISIYATGRILSTEFNAYSDERIKNIIGISDAKKDLEKLAKIEITDYTMKDRLAFSDRLQKKLIGQRLKEVFPEAVSLNTDYVPNIYKTAEVKDGKILLEGKYNVGDRIKLFTKDEEILAQILSYENGILSVDKANPDGEVFIYGTEVKDFHVVDYNAVAMLNVSATQELLRMVQEQQLEIQKLKNQINPKN
ncbi:MAG: hypothetical protein IT222_09445, partial [Crocinitomix sp.]|nr:hypothetical protein [Crocinitomix sp.]